jgi:hypothetical protein
MTLMLAPIAAWDGELDLLPVEPRTDASFPEVL